MRGTHPRVTLPELGSAGHGPTDWCSGALVCVHLPAGLPWQTPRSSCWCKCRGWTQGLVGRCWRAWSVRMMAAHRRAVRHAFGALATPSHVSVHRVALHDAHRARRTVNCSVQPAPQEGRTLAVAPIGGPAVWRWEKILTRTPPVRASSACLARVRGGSLIVAAGGAHLTITGVEFRAVPGAHCGEPDGRKHPRTAKHRRAL